MVLRFDEYEYQITKTTRKNVKVAQLKKCKNYKKNSSLKYISGKMEEVLSLGVFTFIVSLVKFHLNNE